MTLETSPVGRNDPCPCGSGKRFKQCHGSPHAGALLPPAAPPAPDTLVREGLAAHRSGDVATAEARYRAALAAAPDHATALHYLGVVLYQRHRLDEALPLLDRAAALVPQEPEFHNNRGLALTLAQRDAEAVAAFRRALSLKSDHAGAYSNLGLALQATGDLSGAIDAFRAALRLQPDNPPFHWNLALALLLRGDYAEGWREYEWRLRTPELQAQLQAWPGPRWTGDDPAGRTLLVTSEQGLGDTLQNLRFARSLAERGAQVIACVQPSLRQLAATAPGVAAAFGIGEPLPDYDAHVSLMSLPGLLEVTPGTIPAPVPYLRSGPERMRDAGVQVAHAAGTRLKVGIAWSGATTIYNLRRACALATLAGLLRLPGIAWFSLQKEGEAMTAADAPHAATITELALRNDFDGTAALVSALDLVISVDTSLVHLAGALGKPVWVLLPYAHDWRWGTARTDSPWYPNARLFRQSSPGDWSRPLAEMEAALQLRTTAPAVH